MLKILIEEWKSNKNLNSDLGIRLNTNDLKYLVGKIFLVMDGYLYIEESKINSELQVRILRYLEEEMPLKGGWPKNWKGLQLEEVFCIIEDFGIISVRQIGSNQVGNSRFWARKLRKLFGFKAG